MLPAPTFAVAGVMRPRWASRCASSTHPARRYASPLTTAFPTTCPAREGVRRSASQGVGQRQMRGK